MPVSNDYQVLKTEEVHRNRSKKRIIFLEIKIAALIKES